MLQVWMNFENMMLNNTCMPEIEGLYNTTYMKYLEQANSQGQKVDYRLPGTGGSMDGVLLLSGYRVSVWDETIV